MRKAISFILTLALLMTMVMGTPIVASAEDGETQQGDNGGNGGIVYVNGIQLEDGQYLMSNVSDTAITPTDAEESTPSAFLAWYKGGTLYLREANFTSENTWIKSSGDLNIALVADNLLTYTGTGAAIDVAGDLTFTSAEDPATGIYTVGLGREGSLTVSSSAIGIETDGNLNISSGAVIVRGGDCAVEIGDGEESGTPTLHMSGGMLSALATKATGVAMKRKDNFILSDDVKPVQAATSGGVILSSSALDLSKIKYSNKDEDAVCYGEEPPQPLTYILFVEQPEPQNPLESGSLCWLTESQAYTIETTDQSKFMCIRLDWRDFASNSNRIYDNINFQFLSYSFGDNGKATFYVADEGMYIFMMDR